MAAYDMHRHIISISIWDGQTFYCSKMSPQFLNKIISRLDVALEVDSSVVVSGSVQMQFYATVSGEIGTCHGLEHSNSY